MKGNQSTDLDQANHQLAPSFHLPDEPTHCWGKGHLTPVVQRQSTDTIRTNVPTWCYSMWHIVVIIIIIRTWLSGLFCTVTVSLESWHLQPVHVAQLLQRESDARVTSIRKIAKWNFWATLWGA